MIHKKTNFIHCTVITCMLSCVLSLVGCGDQEESLQKTQASTASDKNYCQKFGTPFVYTRCQIDQSTLIEHSKKLSLKLYWREENRNTDKSASPLYNFDSLLSVIDRDQSILFATNAGMYNEKYAPIGYTVINNKQILSLNLNEGAGNFHMLPNGVFWWDKDGFYITESMLMADMLKSGAKPLYATQSGPLLVINKKIHPTFNQQGESKKIRNGVGVCKDGIVNFVITDTAVNFYQFASLFKDTLKCDNALFLDGGIASSLYAPNINRQDGKNMGVIIALIENQTEKK